MGVTIGPIKIVFGTYQGAGTFYIPKIFSPRNRDSVEQNIQQNHDSFVHQLLLPSTTKSGFHLIYFVASSLTQRNHDFVESIFLSRRTKLCFYCIYFLHPHLIQISQFCATKYPCGNAILLWQRSLQWWMCTATQWWWRGVALAEPQRWRSHAGQDHAWARALCDSDGGDWWQCTARRRWDRVEVMRE